MLTLYDYGPSRNAYKVRLLLHHQGRTYRRVEIRIFDGEGRTPEHLGRSPMGAVPAITLEDGRALAESNAILTYLAEGGPYAPEDPFERAQVAQWLHFESDYVQAGVATLRYWRLTGKARGAESLARREALARKTLATLDRRLSETSFLAADRYTIADMAVVAYVARAEEAGLALADYPAVAAWIARVAAQPGFLEERIGYDADPSAGREL